MYNPLSINCKSSQDRFWSQAYLCFSTMKSLSRSLLVVFVPLTPLVPQTTWHCAPRVGSVRTANAQRSGPRPSGFQVHPGQRKTAPPKKPNTVQLNMNPLEDRNQHFQVPFLSFEEYNPYNNLIWTSHPWNFEFKTNIAGSSFGDTLTFSNP